MSMPSNNPLNRPEHFNYLYDKHVQHLNLMGLRPKTMDAYSRAIRRIGSHFDYAIDDLTEDQLLNYFSNEAVEKPSDNDSLSHKTDF